VTLGPQRIVCLSAETVDTLYRLGAADRVVGISGFTVYPPEARRQKPRVSAYTSAQIDRVLALQPDLVLGFSDLQADLLAALMRAGVAVHGFNQRTVAGILDSVHTLGALVAAPEAAQALVEELEGLMATVRAQAPSQRPRVYFEEWMDPMICGIEWVSELIELAGGTDVFAERARAPAASARVVSEAEVLAAAPEWIVASWCGRRCRPEHIMQRPGWSHLPAVQSGQVCEIKSADILQPGPMAIERGLMQLAARFAGV